MFIQNYTIDWGDGNVTRHHPSTKNITHSYKEYGFYNITLTFIGSNSSRNATILFYVNPPGVFEIPSLIFKTYPEETAATAVIMGFIFFLGYAFSETGKYKLLSLLFTTVPLFVRVQKKNALDHQLRNQILELIKRNPGIHYSGISKKLNINGSTLSYHLHVLEKNGFVKSRIEQVRYRAFYVDKLDFPIKEQYRLSDFQLRILNIIKYNKGINQRRIGKILDKKPQNINYHIKLFEQEGFIKLVKKGRNKHCYLTNKNIFDTIP
jgi:DNA-binding MarR family transcriptional regulator